MINRKNFYESWSESDIDKLADDLEKEYLNKTIKLSDIDSDWYLFLNTDLLEAFLNRGLGFSFDKTNEEIYMRFDLIEEKSYGELCSIYEDENGNEISENEGDCILKNMEIKITRVGRTTGGYID